MNNILTVDLEDWYHITGTRWNAAGNRKGRWEERVIPNCRRLLEIFRSLNVKATFFVLGSVAEENPSLVSQISEEGHEIASHGYSHAVLMEMGPEEFRRELKISRNILHSITGRYPAGFRAPSFSVTPETKWAFDVLAEEGFMYDSSVFLANRGEGGYAGMPQKPFEVKASGGRTIMEFPICSQKFFINIPFSGGGYLRLLPYCLVRHYFKQKNMEGIPVVSYIHPRDLDLGQPRLKLPLFKYFKTYAGLKTTEAKLKALLTEFKFKPIREIYGK